MEAIKIENLNFSYGNRKILQGINLELKRNKLTGILGPNGCGKSTLLKNILGYLKSESGNIYIDKILSKNISQKRKLNFFLWFPKNLNLYLLWM